MIVGVVNRSRAATISLVAQGADGQQTTLEAVIDTGFTGFLTLPAALVTQLNLPWLSRQNAVLGDGSVRQFNLHVATVIWDGAEREVAVYVADTAPLVCMGMLDGHEMRMQVVTGGSVTIAALP